MRNKTKAASPLRWMLKRYFFLGVLVFLITFAIFPMQGMMHILSTQRMMEFTEITPLWVRTFTNELTLTFVYSPLNLETLCALFGAVGFCAAAVLYRHLFSRRQGMMIAGLPMTRSRGWALRLEVFAILCLAPMAFCLALYPTAVWMNGLKDLFDLRTYLLRSGTALLITLYGFGAGALCASVFGTIWSAALGGILLTGSAEAAALGWIQIAGGYLNTMNTNHAIRSMLRFSPVYSLYKNFYRPGQAGILPGLAAAAILLALSRAAYRKVLPENAGHTLIRKKLEPYLMFWTVVLGGTAGALALSLYLGTEFMLFAGLILGAGAAALLARMLLDQRIHSDLKKWKIPAAATAVLLLAAAGLHMDLFGYDAWAPQQENLAAVRICPEMNASDAIRCETAENIEAALQWTGQAREEHLAEREKRPFNQDQVLEVLVIFVDRNGRETWREYSSLQDQTAALPALRTLARARSLQQSGELPKLQGVSWYAAMNGFSIDQMDFYDTFGFSLNERMTRLDPAKIRETLGKDLQARTLETLQKPVLLNISFEGVDPETGEYSYADRSYHIFEDDRNTLEAVLGADAEKWIDYSQGGFARSGQLLVFLCEDRETEEGWVLDTYRMAKDESEVREWMKQTINGYDTFFSYPTDMSRRIMVYSLEDLREQAEYGVTGVDPEDPEVQKTLPEQDWAWGRTYRLALTDGQKD